MGLRDMKWYWANMQARRCLRQYVALLDSQWYFARHWRILEMEPNFLEDNDPKNMSRLVREWFNPGGVTVIGWPPPLPNLNSTEHLGHASKQWLMVLLRKVY